MSILLKQTQITTTKFSPEALSKLVLNDLGLTEEEAEVKFIVRQQVHEFMGDRGGTYSVFDGITVTTKGDLT